MNDTPTDDEPKRRGRPPKKVEAPAEDVSTTLPEPAAEPAQEVQTPPEPETPDNVLVWVRLERAITIDEGNSDPKLGEVRPRVKTKRGDEVQIPLSQARAYVSQDLASWIDPRPDLQ